MKRITLLASAMVLTAGLVLANGNHNSNNQGMNQNMMNNNQGNYQSNQGYSNNGQGMGMQGNRGMMNNNQGQGYGRHGQGRGMGMMMGMMGQQANLLTEKQALDAVTNTINTNFKGYKITTVTKFQMPMGLLYSINVKTADGKDATFHVNPWGNVVGPFVVVR